MTLDYPLFDLAQARGVVLLLGLRLERAALARDQNAGEPAVRNLHAAVETQNPSLIKGFAGG